MSHSVRRAAVAILAAAASIASAVASAAQPAASEPASDIRTFQPGVRIDWPARTVRVAGRVVLQAGALEFFACFGGKEHESVVRLNASATHVYAALGLVGLAPGRPPRWDRDAGVWLPPEGDLIDVAVEWRADGKLQRVAACEWVQEIEYARQADDRPWVFSGSLRERDHVLASDRSGAGIALVDFPDSLLSLTRSFPSRNTALWAAAASDRIPALDTPVELLLSPARVRSFDLRLDMRGAILIDGRVRQFADLADTVALQRRLSPTEPLLIRVQGAAAEDERALRARLSVLGVEPRIVRVAD